MPIKFKSLIKLAVGLLTNKSNPSLSSSIQPLSGLLKRFLPRNNLNYSKTLPLLFLNSNQRLLKSRKNLISLRELKNLKRKRRKKRKKTRKMKRRKKRKKKRRRKRKKNKKKNIRKKKKKRPMIMINNRPIFDEYYYA